MAKLLIERNLKNINNIFQHYRMLETGGDLHLISSSLENIIQNSFALAGFKNNLKIILSNLVEALWQCHANQMHMPLQVSPSPPLTLSDFESIKHSKRSLRTSPKRDLHIDSPFSPKSHDITKTLRNEDLHLISEFSYSKGHTFTKEKRMQDPKERMPGPADYHKNPDVCMASSPSITIPKSPRVIRFTNSTTPAPGQYNPIKYFSSR